MIAVNTAHVFTVCCDCHWAIDQQPCTIFLCTFCRVHYVRLHILVDSTATTLLSSQEVATSGPCCLAVVPPVLTSPSFAPAFFPLPCIFKYEGKPLLFCRTVTCIHVGTSFKELLVKTWRSKKIVTVDMLILVF